MPKTSQIPTDNNPTTAYKVVGVSGTPSTVDLTLATLITLFWTLANIPAGATSPITRDNESQFAFVASGLVWTGDAYASTRNASMTSGVCYVNGRRISLSAVTARTFTASRDTYVDVLDNGDGTGTIVYTEVTNNAASPALASNSIRIAIIVAGATTIASAGSVNQGQESSILPIASSTAYSVSDSLGNLICSRDPGHRTLGMAQILSNYTSTNTAETDITGLQTTVNVPFGRKIRITFAYDYKQHSAANTNLTQDIREGSTNIASSEGNWAAVSTRHGYPTIIEFTPTAGVHTYKASFSANQAGTFTLAAASVQPAILTVELA